MRKTIKELENSLEHAQKSRDDYYRKWQELEEKEKRNIQLKMVTLEEENRRYADSITTLREIIRWQINPETAKFPFMPEKNQRDERNQGMRNY